MAYEIEDIEDAIITALAPLKETDSLGVRTVKSYQGELDSEEDLARAARLVPSIFVVYGGSRYEDHGSRKIETLSFLLFVCDKNLRTEEEARRGGSGNPGTYAMLEGIRDLLYEKRLSLDITPLKLLREDPVWFGKGISIYSAEYETAQAHLYTGS